MHTTIIRFTLAIGVLTLAARGADAQIAFSNADNPTPASEWVLSAIPRQKTEEAPQASTTIQRLQRGASATAAAAREGILVDFSQHKNWGGPQSSASSPRTTVARTEEEWQRMWAPTDRGSAPINLPAGNLAVAFFLGQRPSEAYSVRISSVRHVESTDTLLITYTEYRPRPPSTRDELMAKAPQPSSPWAIYLLPATQGPVRFFKQLQMR